MRHFTDGSFGYSSDPFPAFRSNLVFGRNKRDFSFLPTKVEVDKDELLPKNEFRIIKTKEKGTILVVPGEDTTNRALVMFGVDAGLRGSCWLHGDTTSDIIKVCQAGNATQARIEVIAVMQSNDIIVFRSTGRRNDDVKIIEFNGQEIRTTIYKSSEYEALQDMQQEDFEAI